METNANCPTNFTIRRGKNRSRRWSSKIKNCTIIYLRSPDPVAGGEGLAATTTTTTTTITVANLLKRVQVQVLFVLQDVRGVSVSGLRLDVNQLTTLCQQLSSLNRLTSLCLSNNIVDLTPHHDDRRALDAVRSLLSSLPALRHLALADICLTGCLRDILTSVAGQRLVRLELTEHWLDRQDTAALRQLQQQQTDVTVVFS